jgi:hypothetical protein
MATKRKSTKRKSTTKRKVGATRKVYVTKPATRRTTRKKIGAIGTTGEILLGAVAGSFVTRLVMKNLPSPKTATSTDYRPYTGLALGAAAEYFGKKNLLVRSMGIGAIVEGARAVIKDNYIPKVIGSNRLPYTAGTGTMNRKQMKKMMGIKNGLAGKRNPMMIGATSTPNSLAGATSVFGYDGF